VRVIVPFTTLEPGVVEAIEQSGYVPELCDVSGDVEAYWRLLCAVWAQGKDFAVVEHDVVVDRTTLADLERCARDWCAARYHYLGGSYAGLGCVVFKAPLLTKYPTVLLDAARHDYGPLHPRTVGQHWCTLDHAVTTELTSHGLQRHLGSHGSVQHLGGWPSHGCVARPR
jgi:hypothetical protein